MESFCIVVRVFYCFEFNLLDCVKILRTNNLCFALVIIHKGFSRRVATETFFVRKKVGLIVMRYRTFHGVQQFFGLYFLIFFRGIP